MTPEMPILPDSVTIQYTVTVDDMLEADRIHAWRRLCISVASALIAVGAIGPVASALIAAGAIGHLREALHQSIGMNRPLMMILSLYVVFVIAGRFLLRQRKIRRLFRQNKALHDELNATFTAAGMSTKTVCSATNYEWEDFYAWRETPNLFIIWLSPGQYRCVPKRAFTYDAEIEWLRRVLTEKIPKRRR